MTIDSKLARVTVVLIVVLVVIGTACADETPTRGGTIHEGAALVSIPVTGLTSHDIARLKMMSNLEILHVMSPWAGAAIIDLQVRYPAFKTLYAASNPAHYFSGIDSVGQPDQIRELFVVTTTIPATFPQELIGLSKLRHLGFHYLPFSDSGMAQFTKLPNLTHLFTAGSTITDNGLRYVKEMKKLEGIRLFRARITDVGLAHFSELTDLRLLQVGGNRITDAGLQHLSQLHQLEELGLAHCQVTGAGFPHLQQMRQLRWITLYGTPVTDAGVQHLAGLTSLQMLSLGETKITDAALVHVKGLKNLRGLHLFGTHVTDVGLANVADLRNLEAMRIQNTKVGDAGLAYVAGLSNLTELRIHGCPITDAGLKHLRGLEKLQLFYTGDSAVTDAGLDHLRGFIDLRELGLNKTAITDHGLQLVGRFAQLERLQLDETNISDVGLQHLSELKHLKHLHLCGTKITDAGLATLARLNSLAELRLNNARITDAGLAHLGGQNQLVWLGLGFTQIGDQGLQYIENLEHLVELNLPGTRVSDAGLTFIKGIPRLRYLNLDETQITDDGLISLADIKLLRRLYIRKNRITSAGNQKLRTTIPNVQLYYSRLPSERYTLPEGGNDELVAFIESVKKFKPKSKWEIEEHSRRALSSLTTAATRILRSEQDEWSPAYQTALRVLLENRIRAMRGRNTTTQRQAIDFVNTFLSAKLERTLDSEDVELAVSAACAARDAGNMSLAAEAYDTFAKQVAKTGNPELRKTGKALEAAGNVLKLVAEAEEYSKGRDYKKAISVLSKALELNPLNTFVYQRRAIAYQMIADADNAIADYTRLIEIQPDNAMQYAARGRLYRQKKALDAAIADLTKAIETGTNSPTFYCFELAQCYLAAGDLQRAVDNYNTGLLAYSSRYNYAKIDLKTLESAREDPLIAGKTPFALQRAQLSTSDQNQEFVSSDASILSSYDYLAFHGCQASRRSHPFVIGGLAQMRGKLRPGFVIYNRNDPVYLDWKASLPKGTRLQVHFGLTEAGVRYTQNELKFRCVATDQDGKEHTVFEETLKRSDMRICEKDHQFDYAVVKIRFTHNTLGNNSMGCFWFYPEIVIGDQE